jgi:hypothetical protein
MNDKTYSIRIGEDDYIKRNTKKETTLTLRTNKTNENNTVNERTLSNRKVMKKVLLRTGFFKLCCNRLKGNIKEYKKLEIIHEKIKKELEISNYLRLKEDMTMMKAILFTNEESEIFNQLVDFRDVLRIFNESNPNLNDPYEDYLRKSYQPTKLPKTVNMSFINDMIRKIKARYLEKKDFTSSNTYQIRENNFMKL